MEEKQIAPFLLKHVKSQFRASRYNMKINSPVVAKVGRPYGPYPKVSVRLPVTDKKRFSRVSTVQYTLQ